MVPGCKSHSSRKENDCKPSHACAELSDDELRYQLQGERFFDFYVDNGADITMKVDTRTPVDWGFIKAYTKHPANHGYWLFTRANQLSAQIIGINDEESLSNSNFDFSKVTVFLAHGWMGNGSNPMNRDLTEAFLQDADVNVIVFDWSALAHQGYMTAKAGTAAVGRNLGQFVIWLISLGFTYEKVHLVGFSLGGHLVGNAGRETRSRVRRITALDPAGPTWARDRERIGKTDGQYVEVIHTSEALGYRDPCGHADFYPNGAYKMPGCSYSPGCSHKRAYELMASSIKNNHLLANECDSLKDAYDDRCCGDLYPMGNSELNKKRSGIFSLNTRADYPY